MTKLSRCLLRALGTASPKTCSISLPCLLSVFFCRPGLLVPLQQAVEAEGALQRRVVVVGSSVLLAGPADAVHIHSAQWEYLNGTVSRAIVQYNEGSHNVAIHPPYVGRALFHPSNGSLLLEDLQESDSGIYKVTFNLAERESLKILLDVLKPVSRPQLWSSGLVAKATGEVLCEVVEGRVDTITWKKDGQALPQGRGFYVSGNLSILHLRAVKKSDCGSYSCNASNGISWQETSLNVTVAGLSPPLKDVLRIAVVAVVFAAVSGWGLIFPVCQSEKLRIRGELWRWLSAYTCGLVCVSSILAGTAGLLWMREEGPSIAIILPEIVLLYVIVVTFLVAANVTFQPTKLIQLKSTTAQRTMGYAAPGGVLLVVLTSSFHIKNIHHRHEDGCTAFVDVTALAVSTAAVSALPLLAIFLCCPSGPLKCPCPSARILFQPARHWGCFTLG
uniref:Ig-like domain-containing protein n=1 Tax=Anser cygnoides TaxID=8845 RepID=A0A8B9EFI7_ANSCY